MSTIEHKELMKRLKRLSKAVTANIRNVNFGGCGVVAALVGGQLKNFEVLAEVVTPCGAFGEPPAAVRPNVADPANVCEWDAEGVSLGHLAVRFRSGGATYTWDSDGARRSASTFGASGRYTTDKKFGNGFAVEECARISSKQRGWNRSFDRKQIPLLRHLVEHHLKHGM